MPEERLPIVEALKHRALDRCVPLSATIELTLRCNIRCAHCYNFDRETPYPRAVEGRELTDDEVRQLLDDLHAEGCLFVGFTGGEALLHPSIYRFIRHAVRLHLSVIVKTNGTLVTPRTAARMARAGVMGVDVSLHGGTAPTHDRFTGIPGAFEKTVAGARAAKAEGMRVHLSFSLGMHDAAEVEGMKRIAEEVGVECGFDPYITGRYDGKMDPIRFHLDRPTMEALYRGPLAEIRREPRANLDDPPQCACARSVVGISSTGVVYPCIGAPLPSGNLRESRFPEIWRTSPQFARIRGLALDDFATCKPCPHRAWCHRSSGVVYSNTGQYTGPEPFTCMEAEVLHALHDEGAPIPEKSGAFDVQRATVDRRLPTSPPPSP